MLAVVVGLIAGALLTLPTGEHLGPWLDTLGPWHRALLGLAAGALGAAPLALTATAWIRELRCFLVGYGPAGCAYFLVFPLGGRHGAGRDVIEWRRDAGWYVLSSALAFFVTASWLLLLAARTHGRRGPQR